MKNINQDPIEKFQAGSGCFSGGMFTPEELHRIHISFKVRLFFFYQSLLKKLKSKSAWNFSIKVRSLFFNQSLLKILRARSDCEFQIMVWLIRINVSIRLMIAMKNFQSGSDSKIKIKVCFKNSKSGSLLRFSNQDWITVPEGGYVGTCDPESFWEQDPREDRLIWIDFSHFLSWSRSRLCNRDPIWKSISKSASKFKIKVRPEIFNQGMVEKLKSKSG